MLAKKICLPFTLSETISLFVLRLLDKVRLPDNLQGLSDPVMQMKYAKMLKSDLITSKSVWSSSASICDKQ